MGATEFQERFPEFQCIADDRIDMFLADAALIMDSPERWLDFYEIALLYLAAHLLTIGQKSATGDATTLAPVSEQQVDDVVIKKSISAISPTLEDLYSTTYGKTYVMYRRMVFAGIYGV